MFKNKAMQKMYEVCREVGSTGIYGGAKSAYDRGRAGIYPAPYVPGSLAYAAWAAGRDDRKETEK